MDTLNKGFYGPTEEFSIPDSTIKVRKIIKPLNYRISGPSLNDIDSNYSGSDFDCERWNFEIKENTVKKLVR